MTATLARSLHDPHEPQVVTLRGGVPVSLTALRLALDLEARGVTIQLARGGLTASPRRLLTGDDLRLLRTHRRDIARIVEYVDSEEWRA